MHADIKTDMKNDKKKLKKKEEWKKMKELINFIQAN